MKSDDGSTNSFVMHSANKVSKNGKTKMIPILHQIKINEILCGLIVLVVYSTLVDMAFDNLVFISRDVTWFNVVARIDIN